MVWGDPLPTPLPAFWFPLPASRFRFPLPASRQFRFPTYGTTFLGSIRTIHSPVTMSFT